MAPRRLSRSLSFRLRTKLLVPFRLIALSTILISCTSRPSPVKVPVEITFYSSSTKEDWINSVTEAFQAEEIKTSAGKPISVQVFHVSSGGSKDMIIDGEIKPTVWSPGERSWVNSANLEWQLLTGKPLVTAACPPLLQEPTGFAMWRPMAEAMGWPATPIQWRDILELISDPEGWARYGHPEWGQFKLGLTNPETSNSGRLILTGLTYATLAKTQGLTPELVETEPVVEALRKIKQHTVEFGGQSAVLLENMVIGGPDKLHAINTNEAETLKSNARYGKYLPFPLVFIIPAEGTSWGEHPYCILDTEWVSDEQREAARLFASYLLEPAQQMLAVEKGLRPANFSVELAPPISVENGANPEVSPLTIPALESPAADVAAAILELFGQIHLE